MEVFSIYRYDMMVDALVTSALNPYWLWGSVGATASILSFSRADAALFNTTSITAL